ncbi:MAG: AAA family ATPase [Phycisphaerae bacterium]|nr:AAA family ATPase [Phycisphaerae bacterium]
MTDPVAGFLDLLDGVRAAGPNQWTAKCPAHADRNPSLSVGRGDDGRLLATCHANCEFNDILNSVGLKPSDAFPERSPLPTVKASRAPSNNGRAFPTESAAKAHLARSLGGRLSGAWVYQNADGDEVFRVLRFDDCRRSRPKQYRPLRPSPTGWRLGDPPGLLPLYGLPELLDAKIIWLCEGEKCVELFRELGLIATTNAHGAKAVSKTDWSPLAGKTIIICPDHDAAGETHTKDVLEALKRLSPAPMIRVVRLPVVNDGDDIEQFVAMRRENGATDDDIRHELEELVEMAPVVEEEPDLVIVRLADVTPRAQPFLWDGRIPSESCTLLGGRQCASKNLFAYDIIARITTGSPWPDDRTGPRRAPRSAILLEAEEHLESSIVPRLAAAGADLTRIRCVQGAPTDNPDRTRFISIQRDVEKIHRLARRIGDVGLIVVSPVTSYLGSVEQNSNEQVRNEIIQPLKALAETVGCAVLIIKHPNKDWRNTDPLERIAGSTAWTEAMRCVVFIGTDPNEPAEEKNPRRVAMWIKFSIGPTPDPLSWKIRVADTGAPYIHYDFAPVTFTPGEMLIGQRKGEGRKSKRECAAEFIANALDLGPMTAADLNVKALSEVETDRQFSMDAFERARTDLRKAGRLCFERRPETDPAEWWYWLADRSPPEWFVMGEGNGQVPHASRARA